MLAERWPGILEQIPARPISEVYQNRSYTAEYWLKAYYEEML